MTDDTIGHDTDMTRTNGTYSDDYYSNRYPMGSENRYARADPLHRMRMRSMTSGSGIMDETSDMDLMSDEYSSGQYDQPRQSSQGQSSDGRGYGDYMLMNTASEMSAYQKWSEDKIKDIGADTDKILEKLGGKNMGESYDSGVLTGMLAQRGIDPGLVAMLRDNNSFGGDGGMLFLLFLVILMGGGNWGGFGNGGLNNVDRTVINEGNFNQLMTAITSSGQAQTAAVQTLASNLNTDTSAITSALAGVDKAIAVNQGSIISAIQSCCCNIRTELQSTANATQLAILNGNNGIQNALNTGFNGLQNQASQIAFAQQQGANQNTQSILNAINSQTAIIHDGFCDIRTRELESEVNRLRELNAQQRDAANTQMVLTAIANMNELRGTVTGTVDTTAGTFAGTTTGTLS